MYAGVIVASDYISYASEIEIFLFQNKSKFSSKSNRPLRLSFNFQSAELGVFLVVLVRVYPCPCRRDEFLCHVDTPYYYVRL